MNEPPNVTFLLCFERGTVETQAILLAESLRRFGGPLADGEIYAFHPAGDRNPRPETKARLKAFGAHLEDSALRDVPARFPRSGKAFVAAWSERFLRAELQVMVDCDTVFVAPPIALQLEVGIDAGARPVDSKNVASSGLFDRRDIYWRRAAKRCGAQLPPWVRTTVDNRRIRGMWNSGLVVLRRGSGIASTWRRNVETLLAAGLLPPTRPRPGIGVPFVDQVALALAIGAAPERLATLPPGYNYCLPKRAAMHPRLAGLGWGELVHLHYHRSFEAPGVLRSAVPPLTLESEPARWLEARLPVGTR